MSGLDPTNGTIGYRMQQAERRLDRLESFEPAVLLQRINDLHDDNGALSARVQSLQNRVLGLALSIAGGSIIVLITQSGLLH